jgi:hypothetical protein
MTEKNKMICQLAIVYAPLITIFAKVILGALWITAFGFPLPF